MGWPEAGIAASLQAFKTTAARTITWDADSHDSETQEPSVLSRNVLDNVKPGSIVLFHDARTSTPGTLEALDTVLAALSARGYSFVTVSHLLTAGT